MDHERPNLAGNREYYQNLTLTPLLRLCGYANSDQPPDNSIVSSMTETRSSRICRKWVGMHNRPSENQMADLAAKAMAGDNAALAELWQRHRRYAAAVILVYKPATADVEDLLQEVAATLVAKLHTLGDPAAFVPWLRVISMNAGRLAGRKFSANIVRGSLETADGREVAAGAEQARRGFGEAASDALAAASAQAGANELLTLAARLPDEYREPLLLKCLKDLSYRQIGAVLNLPESTIETRIARGRRMLRELAKAAENGETPEKIRVGVPQAPKPTAAALLSGQTAGKATPAHQVK